MCNFARIKIRDLDIMIFVLVNVIFRVYIFSRLFKNACYAKICIARTFLHLHYDIFFFLKQENNSPIAHIITSQAVRRKQLFIQGWPHVLMTRSTRETWALGCRLE